ncbi:receptor-transporting protein 3 [Callorhinchus milii]|uniref:Receptor-transporting protein 3-like protein n=1 Tax=Callorhinchus milii TaxID=7868 RepID=V9L689_CALMI|nr:receptor-transporting protein 3 [Callorhinchus milii]|eukprot:gi/632934057/ref/XP_007897942.1/ PREDICTED: receptor-transporting protein 1 [Callorhinchus milii]
MLNTDWTRLFNDKVLDLPVHDKWTIEEDNELIADGAPSGWSCYITSAFGRFRCSICSKSWASAKVSILFHMQRSGYTGRVKVRFFKQRCRKDHTGAEYEEPTFETDNISPVLDRLMIRIRKKCYNENIKLDKHVSHTDMNGPHESKHCQGCLMGICSQGM